jgi:hypothetical protein
MTLKELLNQVRFEDVLAEVIKYDHKMLDCQFGLKMAFDSLRLMKLAQSDGEDIRIHYLDECDNGEKEEGTPHELVASFCDDEHWDVVAARNIVISEQAQGISKETIAALCVWEASFYGFTEEMIADSFHEMLSEVTPGNKFEQVLRIKNRKSRKLTGCKFRTLKDLLRPIKMNGPKRKRQHRQDAMFRKLHRAAKIFDFLHYKKMYNITGISDETLRQLMGVKSFTYERMGSHSDTPEQAVSYLIELFTKYYTYLPGTEDNQYIVMLHGGRFCRQDMPQLVQVLKEKFQNIHIGIGDANEEQIYLMMINVY